MIKHFIWDFDGTLFDSYPPMVKAYHKALEEWGIDLSQEEILKHMKISVRHLNDHVKKTYGVDDHFIVRFGELRLQYEQDLFSPFPDIIDVCRSIIDRGGKNYIYTHRGASTHMYLEKYGMTDLFDEVVTFENGFAMKPDPQGVRYILNKYGICPDTAIIIGDRELDILSGQNAGIKGCFFSERPEYSCEVADYVISDFFELLEF